MSRTAGSHGPATLAAIRKSGLRLIYEHGYEALTLRALAADVGILSGSLYNHIKTKQDLLFTLVRDHMTDLLANLDLALAGQDDPTEALMAFVRLHVTYHMERRYEVYIANSELRSLEPPNRAAIVAMRQAYESRLIRILDRGVAAGRFQVAETRVGAFAIIAMLTGICSWYRPDGPLGPEEIVRLHTELVMQGLKNDTPPKVP
ncbi:MAG TPA: TetR/AcrR family transcriptional regulator [Aliidongia sp.]|uniref:TetR/AcrR family transcriptional regulator n=1 Tax=Aliidongia sp. TaxID=1914230 RepID=UPI002DDDB0C1|nr:TetR/AcrR family transcriptional regulator [Aliidongia sp.]HEV2678020.1 TetR/AcrR family transcriptional regulator [Aliidongia sp.]